MRIDLSFAEADIGKIKEGQKVRFTVDAFPDRSFTGEVQQIRLNPTTTQNVVTYNVRSFSGKFGPHPAPRHDGLCQYRCGAAQGRATRPQRGVALQTRRYRGVCGQASATNRQHRTAGPGGQNSRNGSSEGKGRGKKREGNSGRVYIVEGRTLKPVQVQLGITDNRNTEVLGGELKPGDTVVIGDAPTSAAKPSSVGMRLF